MLLTEAVWSQFAMQYLWCSQYPHLGKIGELQEVNLIDWFRQIPIKCTV